MTLQAQLRLIAIVTLLSLGGVIVYSIIQLGLLRGDFDRYRNQQLFSDNLAAIKSEALAVSRLDPMLIESEAKLGATNTRVLALQQPLTQFAPAGTDVEKIAHIATLWNENVQGFKLAFEIASTSPEDALTAPDMLYRSKIEPMIADIDKLIETNQSGAIKAEQAISRTVEQIIWIIVVPLVFAGITIVVFQAVFNRRLKDRVDEVIAAMSHLLDGNLTHRLPAGYADEIGAMAATVNTFVARFETILREVNASAGLTILAADKVSNVTQSASSNAQMQSEKVFNAKIAIEEMHRTVMKIAANAEQANKVALRTRDDVQMSANIGRATITGLAKLDDTISHSANTMNGLEQSLKQIGSISKVIRDIAEQTNLLALNAAIEAARAGEYGRGFAVVANEVRVLSERTNSSAKDISNLLNGVQQSANNAVEVMSAARKEAQNGVAHGRKISEVLVSIEGSMQAVVDSMQQIALATQSQSDASTQIAAHIEAVSDITASTSSDIEVTRGEMNGLTTTSQTLHRTIAQFRFAPA
ncbi:MAG: methyl-accepting chemotaxis protein [Gallionella sp.]|nr:methyl-accepting chemotaxis protein [Gallionella sp.]